jgi:phosphate uptake regulator
MRPLHPVYRKIYRISRYTLNVSLPAEYLRRHGLEEGDEVEMQEQEDGSVLLKFLKQTTQPQAEEANA